MLKDGQTDMAKGERQRDTERDKGRKGERKREIKIIIVAFARTNKS